MSVETLPVPSAAGAPGALPAQRVDALGRTRIDYRAITLLALPLMLNSGLQAIVSLTDTWFVGHISTSAIAAMGAVYWVVLLCLVLTGGVGLAVQTFVAQAEGSRRRWRASHAAWIAIWAAVLSVPLYGALAWAGGAMFGSVGLDPEVERQAIEFWRPRMMGGPLGIAAWAILGFFNGISRPRVSVMTTGLVALVNAALNWLFIFEFGWGIAGSAWATNASMLCGVLFALTMFLRPELRRAYKTHLTWRPELRNLFREFRLGFPMGAMAAADLFGVAVPADAGSAEPGGRRGVADHPDADLGRLHAGHWHRAREHHARRPVDRRGRPCLGTQAREPHDRPQRDVHGHDRRPACGRGPVDPAVLRQCRGSIVSGHRAALRVAALDRRGLSGLRRAQPR